MELIPNDMLIVLDSNGQTAKFTILNDKLEEAYEQLTKQLQATPDGSSNVQGQPTPEDIARSRKNAILKQLGRQPIKEEPKYDDVMLDDEEPSRPIPEEEEYMSDDENGNLNDAARNERVIQNQQQPNSSLGNDRQIQPNQVTSPQDNQTNDDEFFKQLQEQQKQQQQTQGNTSELSTEELIRRETEMRKKAEQEQAILDQIMKQEQQRKEHE